MTFAVSPDEALLIQAAAPPGGAPSVSTSPGAISWKRVVELAEWHRLSPLVWRHVREGPDGATAPADVREELRRSARATTAQNMNLQVQLDRVAGALAAAEIPVILLKGAALIETVYPSIDLRPMDDLDLLIPRPLIERAFGVVERLGYAAPANRFTRDAATQLRTSHQHYPLTDPRSGVVIELHHHVSTAWPGFEIDGYWRRAVPVGREPARLVPCPEDLLLHVAVHFTVDRVERRSCALGQVADIAWIADRCDIDWGSLVRRASDYGVADRLFLALMTTRLLLGDVIPEDVAAELRPPSYRLELGEQFVRQRVIRSRAGAPLERLSELRKLIFPDAAGLAIHVRPGEVDAPSSARLYLRRVIALGSKLLQSLSRPGELVDDIRLSRWIRSLRS